MLVNYCGLSGGKDSTATALWLIHQSGEPKESIRFTFCNTHNEHDLTYAHIQMLSERFQAWGTGPIITLEPERGFFELAKWKMRFPSTKARFCTQHLKVIPTRNDVMALIRADHEVIVHSGVRAAESADRAKLPERGFDDMFGCVVNRPLLRWSLKDVFAYHERFGVPLNPLYGQGAQRVGCFPCIHSRKAEIKLISIKFPDRIDEIRLQERQVGKPGQYVEGQISTFFTPKTVPKRFRSLTIQTKNGPRKIATIDDVVRWSHSGKRANENLRLWDEDEGLVCPSGRGMCE